MFITCKSTEKFTKDKFVLIIIIFTTTISKQGMFMNCFPTCAFLLGIKWQKWLSVNVEGLHVSQELLDVCMYVRTVDLL